MRGILKRAGILLLVFLIGVAGTALLLNSQSTDDRSDFNDATFPEVMIDMDGTLINRMYGYAEPMQADFTRDSVTPLDTTKKLKFKVNPYNADVKSFSYEIRTSDGNKVLENKKIKNLQKEDSYLTVDVEITSDLRMNQEYSMQIALETDESTAYYYTRVVSRSQVHASDYAAFVKYFYEACLDKNTADDLGSYLEPETTGAATNYAGININSSKDDQIASMLYVKWLTEKSNFAYDQGGIPMVQGAEYPDVLKDFSDVELVIDNPAPEGEEDYLDKINTDSEVGLNTDNIPDSQIVEHALAGDQTLDQIMDEWNQKWSQAQKDNDIEITE